MPICRKLATNDRLGHDSSRMMTRRNELTGSSLILFWQVSSLSLLLPLLTNAICLAVFYRVTMANVRETSRSPRSTNKKGEDGAAAKAFPSSLSARLKGVSILDEATAWRSYALVAGPRPLLFRLFVRPFDLAREERRIVAREWPRHREALLCPCKGKRGRDLCELRATEIREPRVLWGNVLESE